MRLAPFNLLGSARPRSCSFSFPSKGCTSGIGATDTSVSCSTVRSVSTIKAIESCRPYHALTWFSHSIPFESYVLIPDFLRRLSNKNVESGQIATIPKKQQKMVVVVCNAHYSKLPSGISV